MKNSCVGLKICEGCGALWFRHTTTTSVYCRSCVRMLAEFPETKRRHRTPSTRTRTRHTTATNVLQLVPAPLTAAHRVGGAH